MLGYRRLAMAGGHYHPGPKEAKGECLVSPMRRGKMEKRLLGRWFSLGEHLPPKYTNSNRVANSRRKWRGNTPASLSSYPLIFCWCFHLSEPNQKSGVREPQGLICRGQLPSRVGQIETDQHNPPFTTLMLDISCIGN